VILWKTSHSASVGDTTVTAPSSIDPARFLTTSWSPRRRRVGRDLDEQVEAFRTRPLEARPYTFVAADALGLKVREGGRVVNVHALLAAGVNADGHRRSSAAGHLR
jgi:hypothetical protein